MQRHLTKKIVLLFLCLFSGLYVFAARNPGGETSPQAHGASTQVQKVQAQKSTVESTPQLTLTQLLDEHGEKLGKKNTKKLERLLARQTKKHVKKNAAGKKDRKISEHKKEKIKKMKERLENKIAKVSKTAANSSYVRLGVILALVGVAVALLLSSYLGGILILVGLILLIVGLV